VNLFDILKPKTISNKLFVLHICGNRIQPPRNTVRNLIVKIEIIWQTEESPA
jgi:hypothetical protein